MIRRRAKRKLTVSFSLFLDLLTTVLEPNDLLPEMPFRRYRAGECSQMPCVCAVHVYRRISQLFVGSTTLALKSRTLSLTLQIRWHCNHHWCAYSQLDCHLSLSPRCGRSRTRHECRLLTYQYNNKNFIHTSRHAARQGIYPPRYELSDIAKT